MNFQHLNEIIKNEPAFRQKQVFEFIFQKNIIDWNEATSLPKTLRQQLIHEVDLDVDHQLFTDPKSKTTKALITLNDGLSIETVLMRHSDIHNTVCVSTQVGCPAGCLFCATGQMGFKRNLSAEEMVEQVLLFSRLLKAENQRVSHVVFMGMGEPFLNQENVFQAIEILNNKKYFNIGSRRISISTVGVVEGIEALMNYPKEINLAISLHAPNDQLRSEIIPFNKKYSLAKILSTVDRYIEKTHRKVMFEYVLIKGINDSLTEAKQLVDLLRGKLCMVNLIVYNKTQNYEPTNSEQVIRFKNYLQAHGLEVTQRLSYGNEITAACGQLATGKISK